MRIREFCTILAAAVLVSADKPMTEAPTGQKKLWAGISVNRPIFEASANDRPTGPVIYFTVVNDSNDTVDPEMNSSNLFINGTKLTAWPRTISSGPRDVRRWKALPPRDYLFVAIALGDHFAKPGVYTVKWKGEMFESSEITFRVLPKRKR
jgi:hypothetical protein